MRSSLIVIFILSLTFTIGCIEKGNDDLEPKRNSIITIIANPENYDGKKVSVIGYISINQENNAVFMHKEDFNNIIYANAIWLNIPLEDQVKYLENNEAYCWVQGVYRAGKNGFGGFYCGSIDVEWLGSYLDVATIDAMTAKKIGGQTTPDDQD